MAYIAKKLLGIGHTNNIPTPVSSENGDQSEYCPFNPFKVTDDQQIIDEIRFTHEINTDNTFDHSSLFTIVRNILKRSTQIVDEFVQGSEGHTEIVEEKINTTNINFNAPLCLLRQIVCEIMSCNIDQDGLEVAHETTKSILTKLQYYSWEAKAVLTLAAFAMEFGDFSWLLHQINQSADEEFLKSLGTLRKVFVFAKSPELQKRKPQALVEIKLLNDLIINAMQVMEKVFMVEKLSTRFDPKGQSALPITVIVYWIIITVVTCAAKVTSLTCEAIDKTHDLTLYSAKIRGILEILVARLKDLNEKKETAERYRKLETVLKNPNDVLEVLKAMFCTPENAVPLFDCHTNTRVEIDELRGKNIYLLISGLDISENDIKRINQIHEKIARENTEEISYQIVWIPIVENWSNENQKEFEKVRSKMNWYAVKFVSETVGIKYITEEWHFKGKTTFLAMNQKGYIENSDAFPLICLRGTEAFPYDKKTTDEILEDMNWLHAVVSQMGDPELKKQMEDQESYIFLYGGRDQWTKKFYDTAKTLENNRELTRANISLYCIGNFIKDNVTSQFWSGIEHLFVTKDNNNKKSDAATKQIQTLLSYKYKEGWVLVSKGSRSVMAGHGDTILNALVEFINRGDTTSDGYSNKSFEDIFIECYDRAIDKYGGHCCELHIKGFSGKQLEERKCAECSATMEMTILYECCHKGFHMEAHP